MTIASDVAAVNAALVEIDKVVITNKQMVLLIKNAISLAFITNSMPIVQTSVGGKSFQISFDQARAMLKHFQDLVDDEEGPIVRQGVFRDVRD